jgi:biopolymer transport protein ExbB/TolQ
VWALTFLVTFCVSTVAASAWSAIRSFRSARRADRAAESLREKLRFIESRIASLESSVSEWSQTTTDLANSLKMTRVRQAAKLASATVPEKPDPYKDPEGWRAWQNRNLPVFRAGG